MPQCRELAQSSKWNAIISCDGKRRKKLFFFIAIWKNISICKIPTPNEFEKWAVSSGAWSGRLNANIWANKHPNNVTNQHFQKRNISFNFLWNFKNDLTFDVNLWPQLQMKFLRFNRIYHHSSSLASIQSIMNAKGLISDSKKKFSDLKHNLGSTGMGRRIWACRM